MSNLETTENKNQVKWDLAGPMLELLQYNIAVSNDLGSLILETSEEGRTRIILAHVLQWLVSHVRVIALSKSPSGTKTGNAIAAVTSNGSAKTNEKRRNFFLRSGLKFMHGERVGIQVHHHGTNQIKTRKEPAHKSVVTADFFDLECDIKIMTPKMMGFMSDCFSEATKTNFKTLASEEVVPEHTKTNIRGLGRQVERIHNREGKLPAVNLLTLLSDCFDHNLMLRNCRTTNPRSRNKSTTGQAYMAQAKTGNDKRRKFQSDPGRKDFQDKKRETPHANEPATIEMLFKRLGDMNSTIGQLSGIDRIVKTLQENQNPNKSSGSRNDRNDHNGQGKNANDRGRPDKQIANNPAQAGPITGLAVTGPNTAAGPAVTELAGSCSRQECQ